MATNTRKLASLLGASGAGIANDGTLTSAAIGEVIVAGDIAANAIGASELADNAVDTAAVADNAVTLAKMAGGTDGQVITYDASGDPVAVGPGTDGQVLTSTGAGSPPAFEALPASGTILQTVFNEYSTHTAITSTTYASPTSTGLTCAITPQNSGSKILCQIFIYLFVRVHTSAADGACAIRVHDGTSYVYSDGTEGLNGLYVCGGTGDPSDEIRARHATAFYINAGSTSARTYTVSGFLYPTSNSPTVSAQGGSSKSQMILQEIAQ